MSDVRETAEAWLAANAEAWVAANAAAKAAEALAAAAKQAEEQAWARWLAAKEQAEARDGGPTHADMRGEVQHG